VPFRLFKHSESEPKKIQECQTTSFFNHSVLRLKPQIAHNLSLKRGSLFTNALTSGWSIATTIERKNHLHNELAVQATRTFQRQRVRQCTGKHTPGSAQKEGEDSKNIAIWLSRAGMDERLGKIAACDSNASWPLTLYTKRGNWRPLRDSVAILTHQHTYIYINIHTYWHVLYTSTFQLSSVSYVFVANTSRTRHILLQHLRIHTHSGLIISGSVLSKTAIFLKKEGRKREISARGSSLREANV